MLTTGIELVQKLIIREARTLLSLLFLCRVKYLLYFTYKLQELKLFFTLFFEIYGVYGVFWPSVCINTQFGMAFQIILTD